MRDRLEELRQRAQEFRQAGSEMDHSPFPVEDETEDPAGLGVMAPQAVMFEEEPVLQNFLSEAQHVRDNLTELESEVSEVSIQQHVGDTQRYAVGDSIVISSPFSPGAEVQPAAEEPGGHHASLQCDEEGEQCDTGHQAAG